MKRKFNKIRTESQRELFLSSHFSLWFWRGKTNYIEKLEKRLPVGVLG